MKFSHCNSSWIYQTFDNFIKKLSELVKNNNEVAVKDKIHINTFINACDDYEINLYAEECKIIAADLMFYLMKYEKEFTSDELENGRQLTYGLLSAWQKNENFQSS